MQWNIRHARIDDIDVLTEFNCRLAQETEDKELPVETVRLGVQRGLNLEGDVQYFVAQNADQVIGQLMVTREWSDWRNGWIAWLQSVYVLAEFRGQGVFRQLFQHAKSRLQESSETVAIRLYVEQDNRPAVATYESLGFKDPCYRVMEMMVDE